MSKSNSKERDPYIFRARNANVPESWDVRKYSEVVDLEYGNNLPKKDRIEGDYPVYGSNGISGWHNDYHIEPPGIVVGRKGTLETKWCEEKFNVIDTAYYINEDCIKHSSIDIRYLFYNLKAFDFRILESGSAVPSLSRDDFYNETVAIPPIDEQKKISYLLQKIDEKIEVNDHINSLSEEIAQLLFKSWFVDFNSYEEFKQSDVGQIPNEFSIKNLESVLSFQRGYSYSGDELIDEESDLKPSDGYSMINLGTISPGGGYNEDGIKYCNELPKEMYRTKPGDLVISHTDMTQDLDILGSPVMVPKLDNDEMLFSHHLYKVVDNDLPTEYLYFYFLSPYFKPKAENFASGTTVLSFSSKIASDVKIPIPPEPELERFVQKTRPIFKIKEEIRKENKNLADLRDTLLPKLMTGEIRVNDLELDELEVDNEV
ncbi:restriction endonuclease subunit S [Halorubrum trapanicum]|uniref:restriction endonuclease subunit S n=1 Tax=Halorubrum trapanicum TaxID=29284 RepID=UPI003C6F7922